MHNDVLHTDEISDHDIPYSILNVKNDQVTILNKLILDCIEKHAPVKRIRLTRPVVLWMKDESIVNLKTQLEHHRQKARTSKEENGRKNYQVTRNKLKKTIKTTKAAFLRKAMSSKNPKEVWSTVNRILTKQRTRIKQHPSDLNNHFTTLHLHQN